MTRILEDMTDAVERLCMRWKEKSLTIVAWPSTEYKSGDVVEIISNSGTSLNLWRHWAHGEITGVVQKPACGTGSPKRNPCFMR